MIRPLVSRRRRGITFRPGRKRRDARTRAGLSAAGPAAERRSVRTVVGFTPYRLDVQRHDGAFQTIDLKNGTVIRPLDATPQSGRRVAAIGYRSRGTFVANRIVLRF